jgi:hypothetical protein
MSYAQAQALATQAADYTNFTENALNHSLSQIKMSVAQTQLKLDGIKNSSILIQRMAAEIKINELMAQAKNKPLFYKIRL